MKTKIRSQIFWDTDPKTIDYNKNKEYVIKKVLEYGNENDFRNLRKKYPSKVIKSTLMNARGLSPKSANFWAIIFNMDQNKIKCLKKPYLKKHTIYWPH